MTAFLASELLIVTFAPFQHAAQVLPAPATPIRQPIKELREGPEAPSAGRGGHESST